MKRKTNERFLSEMSVNHPTLTPLEKYINGRTKINIHCNVCNNNFKVKPLSLYMGHGCPVCGGTHKKSHDEFVNEMSEIDNTIIIIDKYINDKTKLKVRCSICGNKWYSAPNTLLAHKGCAKCNGNKKKTQSEFISDMKVAHPEIRVIGEYVNNRAKIKCYCNNCHNYFYGIPHAMLDGGNGCPLCSISHGERQIKNWLDDNNIKYIKEYKFSDCKDKALLPFDFYLPAQNTIIEYDGRQHYEPNDFFGGKVGFENTKRHDRIKDKYCRDNNIKLIRIPYWNFNNIDNILSSKL